MTVSLPKPLRKYVTTRVRNGGFGSVSDFIRDLIRRDQRETERANEPAPMAADSMAAVPQAAWRQLHASLTRGADQLSADRLQESAALMQTGILLAREQIRRDFPAASDAELDRQLAQWLHERAHAGQGDGPGRPVSAERRRRILGEP